MIPWWVAILLIFGFSTIALGIGLAFSSGAYRNGFEDGRRDLIARGWRGP